MIPLYRGELHKVSGVPRQWTVPKTQISLSVFRSALKKRNAALNDLLQSSTAQKWNFNATPVVNGMAETSAVPSTGGSAELGKRGGLDNDDDSIPDGKAENGAGSSGSRPTCKTEQFGRVDEATGKRWERKRRREEDSLEVTRKVTYKTEDSTREEGGHSEEPSKGKCKVLHEGSEPMMVDVMDHRVAIDCDVRAGEKSNTDSDEIMAGRVRVRVSDKRTGSEPEIKQGYNELETQSAIETKRKDAGNLRRNGESAQPVVAGTAISSFEETKSIQILPSTADGKGTGAEVRVINEKIRKREELEAKLEKLRAEKHRFVLRLKQVLNEEEVKKRSTLTSGSPATLQGAVAGANDSTGVSTHEDKYGIGGGCKSADLEDGELEYARTPSPPFRAIPSIYGSHGTVGPHPPMAPLCGRQTSLSQHLSQNAAGRGAYYVPGRGVPPPPVAPGIAGGAPSPGVGFMGNLPSPLGSHCYSHNLALQHAAAFHAQTISSVSHGHGQFSPVPSRGGPIGPGPGVTGGPPGFCGYPISSVHSHHSHLSQPPSSLPHMPGQQGVNASSLLTTPRGPPGYHDIRLGGNTWIQR